MDEVVLSEELAGDGARAASADVAEYALWLGDDALILSQQLGGWISRAPELEEDVALANIALDLLGHARSLLRYAGSYDARGEDDLAYFRDEPDFRSCWLVEQPNGDFAQTIARQFLASTYMFELYSALGASTDDTLAAVAEKAVKEVDYHRDHAVQWMLRLAGGTEESRRRLIRAVGDVWPYADELFRDEPLIDRLAGVAVRPSSLRAGFDAVVATVFGDAGLEVPTVAASAAGGRRGSHATGMGHLLAEMQVLARRHPGGDMVTLPFERRQQAWRVAASVADPEVPVLTIEDLGVLRAVDVDDDAVRVTLTPTYSGCPAMETIRDEVVLALTAAGFDRIDVRFVLSPAWTTDWMSDAGKQKLTAYGIAPPGSSTAQRKGPIPLALLVRCPRCGSPDTHEVSRFGSTSCKALYECRSCLEPFDHFKAI